MKNSKFLLEITKILLLTILIVLISTVNFNINQKLDEIIKLNTPEQINVIPEQVIIELN